MNLRIGENIKRLRRERNLTQETVAAHLGVSFQSVSKWERGLDTPISNGGGEFSGGQRKCLLLVRALLENSPVYLLDEAFAGVDQRHGELIWKELNRVAEKALVIVITHDQSVLSDGEKGKGRLLAI